MLGICEAREMPQAVSVNTVPLSALTINKWKKLQFIHKLTASDTSKTAKITKGDYPISTSPKCQCAAE